MGLDGGLQPQRRSIMEVARDAKQEQTNERAAAIGRAVESIMQKFTVLGYGAGTKRFVTEAATRTDEAFDRGEAMFKAGVDRFYDSLPNPKEIANAAVRAVAEGVVAVGQELKEQAGRAVERVAAPILAAGEAVGRVATSVANRTAVLGLTMKLPVAITQEKLHEAQARIYELRAVVASSRAHVFSSVLGALENARNTAADRQVALRNRAQGRRDSNHAAMRVRERIRERRAAA